MKLLGDEGEPFVGDDVSSFFLAMAHQQLGDKDLARTWYDKGVQRLEKESPKECRTPGLPGRGRSLAGDPTTRNRWVRTCLPVPKK